MSFLHDTSSTSSSTANDGEDATQAIRASNQQEQQQVHSSLVSPPVLSASNSSSTSSVSERTLDILSNRLVATKEQKQKLLLGILHANKNLIFRAESLARVTTRFYSVYNGVDTSVLKRQFNGKSCAELLVFLEGEIRPSILEEKSLRSSNSLLSSRNNSTNQHANDIFELVDKARKRATSEMKEEEPKNFRRSNIRFLTYIVTYMIYINNTILCKNSLISITNQIYTRTLWSLFKRN
jgi:hypothetical protein